MAESDSKAAAAAPTETDATDVPAEALAPIIVKKIIVEGHGGAHGGAWKIALADMMTAMMAFFLLMWLLGAVTEEKRKSVADYFKPNAAIKSALTVNTTSGSVGLMGGQSIIDDTALPKPASQTGLMQVLAPRESTGTADSEKDNAVDQSAEEKKRLSNEADKASFEKLQKELSERLEKDKDLANLRDQVNFVREKEGLRIEVIDKADFSMFALGTTKLSPRAQALITEISRKVAEMPNKIKVRGHTDSVPYVGAEQNNWSLSTQRAETTRQIMAGRGGVDEKRFARIEGVADTEPFNAADGMDPRNRRISITLMYQDP